GIGQRGHHFRRLIHQQIHAPLFRFDGAARSFNAIFVRVGFRPKLGHDVTVHANLSAQNQLLCMSPRSNSCPRNNFLQSLLHNVVRNLTRTRHFDRSPRREKSLFDLSKISKLKLHYSPAAAPSAFGGSSSNSPAGIPSLVAATSSSINSLSVAPFSGNGKFSSVSAVSAFIISSSVCVPAVTPASLPSASRASASNSFKLGNSSRSLRPNRIRNSLDDLY